jgi:hypothetical protein
MDMIDVLPFIKQRLAAEGLESFVKTSKGAGVAFETLRKIKDGRTPDPRYSTVAKLAKWYGITASVKCNRRRAPKGK